MKSVLRQTLQTIALALTTLPAFAQSQAQGTPGQSMNWMPDLTQPQDYTLERATSKEPTGANADARTINPGVTLTLLDTDGPGLISHMWYTIATGEPYHLKRIVMRLYWDNEATPSVETPIGDFFGLGTGDYITWQSELLSVGNSKALNSFFPMPYRKHARITITNEGKNAVGSFYYNVEYRTYKHPLPAKTLYFHAQYRQAQPNKGWTDKWFTNYDALVLYNRNHDGKDNYIWFEAQGEGHYVGVTMSVLQNQDGWWGEGNDMFYVDGAAEPAMAGTGTEDYFLGAWDFGSPFSYQLYGAPLVGKELAGQRSSVYRFHLDSPIPFSKSMRGTIEHGSGNHRSDNFYSVAYWYQTEPHMAFPPLPPVDDRIPTLYPTGGPGTITPDGKSSTPVR